MWGPSTKKIGAQKLNKNKCTMSQQLDDGISGSTLCILPIADRNLRFAVGSKV